MPDINFPDRSGRPLSYDLLVGGRGRGRVDSFSSSLAKHFGGYYEYEMIKQGLDNQLP